MELKDIKDLIRFVSKSGIAEVKVKVDNSEINIKNLSRSKEIIAVPTHSPAVIQEPQAQAPVMSETPHSSENISTGGSDSDAGNNNYITIKSPMIGTFYRRPSPEKDTFVNVGDSVTNDTVVCVVEAMKLFNEIEAEVSGKIVKVLVEDSTPVEFDQPLFLIDPS